MFRLGPLVIDRGRGRVWIGERPLVFPKGALFDVMLALAEAWERDVCVPHGFIWLPSGKRHLFGHDDVGRLRKCIREAGCKLELLESVENVGHRLIRCVWAPLPQTGQRRSSGTHRCAAARTRGRTRRTG